MTIHARRRLSLVPERANVVRCTRTHSSEQTVENNVCAWRNAEAFSWIFKDRHREASRVKHPSLDQCLDRFPSASFSLLAQLSFGAELSIASRVVFRVVARVRARDTALSIIRVTFNPWLPPSPINRVTSSRFARKSSSQSSKSRIGQAKKIQIVVSINPLE